jgi:hypothetical protein
MARQVPIVAILMIVQGSLSILMGLFFAVAGPLLFALMSSNSGPQEPPPEAKTMFQVVSGIYLAIGVAAMTAGVLNIVGGVRALRACPK